jgi:hypothetical protein
MYDPASGTWTPAASMLVSRWLHVATRLPSDVVLVAGGAVLRSDGSSFPSDEAELYDPPTGTWRRTGSLFTAHATPTATQLTSGRVLVVGGTDFVVLANTDLFDPESETWTDAGCMNNPRNDHTATLLGSGAVLVAGGSTRDLSPDSSAELYGILVSPTQVSLAPGANLTFTAKGGSGHPGSGPVYVWSFVKNESGATLTASGGYQAGSVGGVTDVIQVVDSLSNSSTATVNVLKQAAAVSSTRPQAKSVGCGITGGIAPPLLGLAVLVLLGWRSLGARRRPMA